MKKILALFLVCILCFGLCACEKVETADDALIFQYATQAVADYVDDEFGIYPDKYDIDYQQDGYEYTVTGTCKETSSFTSLEVEVEMTYDPEEKSFEINSVSASR